MILLYEVLNVRLKDGIMIKLVKKILERLKNKNYFFKKLYESAAETYLYFKYKNICHKNPTDDKIIIFE